MLHTIGSVRGRRTRRNGSKRYSTAVLVDVRVAGKREGNTITARNGIRWVAR